MNKFYNKLSSDSEERVFNPEDFLIAPIGIRLKGYFERYCLAIKYGMTDNYYDSLTHINLILETLRYCYKGTFFYIDEQIFNVDGIKYRVMCLMVDDKPILKYSIDKYLK